jgi:exopolyphosphatase / guanosine-5'-triphosphate,3'-diphosphate pyrophosphatase
VDEREAHRPIAVVDLGSNSVRLVVYDGLSRAPMSRFNERRLCGLGREVARSGRLGSDGKACALESLKRFVTLAQGMGCGVIDVVATAAIRSASDGAAFVAAAAKEVGLPITVLSGPDEARFGALGVLCGFAKPEGMMGDLGGGSVEFAILPPDETTPAHSLPLGALVLSESLRNGASATQRLIDEHLAAAPGLWATFRGRDFYVVGGSWRALARARMAIMDHPLRVVHGYTLSAAEAETLGATMARADPRELARMPGFPRRRIDTIPGAAMLLASAVRRLEPARVIFSATGLREGRLMALLDREDWGLDPLLVGATELGTSVNRMPGIGDAMDRWTAALFPGEPPAQTRLRRAICQIADTAWREHPETRAREAFLRLVQYPFLGLDHRERACLAYATFVRYEGARDDPTIRRVVQLLDPGDLAFAVCLGEALELGYRVSGGVPAILDACPIRIERDVLRLQARTPAIAIDDDGIRTRLKAVAAALGIARTSPPT